MYRAQPEVSKICVRAARERAYKQHIHALKRVHHLIDTSHPETPVAMGKNLFKYELDKQRNTEIKRENLRLIKKLDRIYREEHFVSSPPSRPYTLQGINQREEMMRITQDNKKLMKAVQSTKPILNRNDWMQHKIEHEYQHHKMSEFKPTLPISEIVKLELEPQSARRKNPRRTPRIEKKPEEEIQPETKNLTTIGDEKQQDENSNKTLVEHQNETANTLFE